MSIYKSNIDVVCSLYALPKCLEYVRWARLACALGNAWWYAQQASHNIQNTPCLAILVTKPSVIGLCWLSVIIKSLSKIHEGLNVTWAPKIIYPLQ